MNTATNFTESGASPPRVIETTSIGLAAHLLLAHPLIGTRIDARRQRCVFQFPSDDSVWRALRDYRRAQDEIKAHMEQARTARSVRLTKETVDRADVR
jgi:hypothetical protein